MSPGLPSPRPPGYRPIVDIVLGIDNQRGYVYFAMAFSLAVELPSMRFRAKQKPITLHQRFEG